MVLGRLLTMVVLALACGLLSSLSYAAEWGEPPEYDPGDTQCTSYHSDFLDREVRYCVALSQPGKQPRAIAYFMHGIMGSSRVLIEKGYGDALKVLCEKSDCPSVAFVSFDTVRMSFFSDAGGIQSGEDAYESWFIAEFMPLIETKLSTCRQRECRALAGLSMGGFGAIKTALRYPTLFSAAAGNSPALMPFNVQAPDPQWSAYFDRHIIGRLEGNFLLPFVRRVFTTPRLSDENDPSWLAAKFKDLSIFPSLYFDVGDLDYFGFDEGFKRFSDVLNSRGISFEATLVHRGTHELFMKRRWNLVQFLLNHFQATRDMDR